METRKNHHEDREIVSLLLIGAILATYLLLGLPMISTDAFGYNQSMITITQVNVTNSPPEVRLLQVYDNISSNRINLIGGATQVVVCNASVYDDNGGADVDNATARLFHSSSNYTAPLNNNTHYLNSTCGDCSVIDADNARCECTFLVLYYANNGTWTCNLTAVDAGGYTSGSTRNSLNGSGWNTSIINSLLSIDVPGLIDFGNLTVGQTSELQTANVTNYGNVPIRVQVKAYGDNNESNYSASAMHCARGNIALSNERYSANSTGVYTAMTPITNNLTTISTLWIDKKVETEYINNSMNSTYWKLYVPTGVAGFCNGTVVFNAISGS